MLISILVILIAISIHEFAHAYVANRLGDPTPQLAGRLTLNPLAHLDPFGTIALIVFGFGWGKPVPIDSYNFRNPRRDQALVALAGPASNIIFSIIIAVLFRLFPQFQLISFIYVLIRINLSLAVFNLLPFNPLDGAKVVLGFLPFRAAEEWDETINSYGLPLLIITLLPLFGGRSLIDLVLSPVINFSLHLLLSHNFTLLTKLLTFNS